MGKNEEKSVLAAAYEKYLESDSKTKIQKGSIYYKIIYKADMPANVGGVELVLPRGILHNGKGMKAVDENGRAVSLIGPATMHFRDGIPKWYFETAVFVTRDCCSSDEIGQYMRLAE